MNNTQSIDMTRIREFVDAAKGNTELNPRNVRLSGAQLARFYSRKGQKVIALLALNPGLTEYNKARIVRIALEYVVMSHSVLEGTKSININQKPFTR